MILNQAHLVANISADKKEQLRYCRGNDQMFNLHTGKVFHAKLSLLQNHFLQAIISFSGLQWGSLPGDVFLRSQLDNETATLVTTVALNRFAKEPQILILRFPNMTHGRHTLSIGIVDQEGNQIIADTFCVILK